MVQLQALASFFGQFDYLLQWPVVIIIFIGALLFLILPQLNRISAHNKFLSTLKVGDRVVTTGGLVGILTDVDGEILKISFVNMEKISILRSAIERTFP